jgi:hypothetical protein
MAGLGRKVFTAGDVLTASDVQNYLQDQAVMVFAGTAARSSAIATPSEGMFAVTTNDDELDYYNGSAWVPALPVGAWQSWAPVLSGGWSNGNGVWTAAYTQIGKTVHVRAKFVVGTLTTKGTGLDISLPVTANTNAVLATSIYCGYVVAGGGTTAQLSGFISTTTKITLNALNAAGTYLVRANVTATVPATWATADEIYFSFTYEAA